MVLSVSRAGTEDVRFSDTDMSSAVLAAFAFGAVCLFTDALARVVALILVTVPFAFVT